MGKQFYSNVNGVEDINKNLEKMNADSKRNFVIGLTGAITGILGLAVAIFALFKS